MLHEPLRLPALRAATRTAHATLDERVTLLDAGLDHHRYAAYLQAMSGLIAPLEAALDRVSGLGAVWPDLHERYKAHLLRADLLDLRQLAEEGSGLPEGDAPPPRAADRQGPLPPAENRRETPREGARDLPRVDSLASALGVGYVLEGSTLGGAVLARAVKERLGGAPTRYFECYGNALGPRWRSFLGYLEGAALDEGDQEALVAAAVGTFHAVKARFAAAGLLR